MSWWVLPLAAAHAEVVDRVVAVVEDRPLLASEIAIQAELARRDPSSRLPPPPDDPTEWAIDAACLRTLADQVRLYDPSDDEVRSRIEGLRNTFADRAAWGAFLTRLGLDEARLEPMVRRQLVVERYLLRNLQADPSDPVAWAAAVEAFVGPLRASGRVPVRHVPASAP